GHFLFFFRPLPACPAGEGVHQARQKRGKPLAFHFLAKELLHLPDKPAEVEEGRLCQPFLAKELLHLPDKQAGVEKRSLFMTIRHGAARARCAGTAPPAPGSRPRRTAAAAARRSPPGRCAAAPPPTAAATPTARPGPACSRSPPSAPRRASAASTSPAPSRCTPGRSENRSA